MTRTVHAQGQTLPALLEAMAAELRSLGAMTDRVQDALSPALTPAVLSHPEVLASIQDLDRLAQTVRALAAIAERLSDCTVAGEVIDPEAMLRSVPLGDLAARLGAALPSAASMTPKAQAEEWDDGFTIRCIQPA